MGVKEYYAIIIIGDSCVGKTYIGRQILNYINKCEWGERKFVFVEMSDVVKQLSRRPNKDGLDLLNDDRLIKEIRKILYRHKNIVLCGLREKRIHDMLKKTCNLTYTLKVTAPDDVIAQRCKKKRINTNKIKRDKLYDYHKIVANDVINNVGDKSWFCITWYPLFRRVAGLPW